MTELEKLIENRNTAAGLATDAAYVWRISCNDLRGADLALANYHKANPTGETK